MLLAVIAFAVVYVLMIVLGKYRHFVAFAGALFFAIAGITPFGRLVDAIDWNILLMLFGTMGTVSYFIASGMPKRMAEGLIKLAPNTMWAVVIISLFAGIVSAFMDNVATVLMIAPIGLAVAKELKISPVPMIICIAVSSNLQGAATLVGDTTSIMMAGEAGMDFMDFFFFNGRASTFFAVELGALATIPVIMFLFRKEKGAVSISTNTKVTDYAPTVLLLANIILLISASFIQNKPAVTNGIICTAFFIITSLVSLIRNKNAGQIVTALREVDYQTLLQLGSLFVIIYGISEAGVLKIVADAIASVGGSDLFLVYTLIVWGSVLISAFVDNIPYVATMLPVVTGIAAAMGCSPNVLYFGLLTGATLGGNITPIGASANVAGIGILRREGYEVKNKDFFRIGIPFTLIAVLVGYLFVWFVWGGVKA